MAVKVPPGPGGIYRKMDIESERKTLEAKLREEIPLTQPLGLAVGKLDDSGLTLHAPLDRNRNHEGTAFAGSVNAVATLAGWGLVWLMVRRAGLGHAVVLQNSEVHFTLPVACDFSASAKTPDQAASGAFLEAIRRHGKGRIVVEVEVSTGMSAEDGVAAVARPAARFSGRYVAIVAD